MDSLLSTADVVTIIVSLLSILAAGLLGGRRGRSDNATQYILAGRSLTLPVFVASLVATWYGSILGATEFVVNYGIAFLVCFGLPYYTIAIIYARWLAKRIRRSEAVSIPDQIRIVYGKRAASVAAVMMLVITIPASYQLSLALITQTFTGWTLGASLLVTSAFSFLYIVKGGLRSDAYANVVQAGLMYLGYIACVIFCVTTLGSFSWLAAHTPQNLLDLPGPLGWMPIVVWTVIALQTFIDPNFHVRTAAAADADTARRGVYLSVAAWIVFDILQLVVGLYALAALGSSHGAQSAIHVALQVLPDIWRGIYVAGIVAAVMSALDGYALVSGTTLAHDLFPTGREERRTVRLRLGVAMSLCIGGIVAYAFPSVIDLIYRAASIAVPAILIPLLCSYTNYAGRIQTSIVQLIVVPATASLCIMIAQAVGLTLPVVAEPMLVGILVSVAMLLIILIRSNVKSTPA